MDKIRELALRYRQELLYLFFGGCTTLVNILVYAACAHGFGWSTTASSAAAWVLSVLFAYATNRKWVFESDAGEAGAVLSELLKFMLGRVATGLLDIGIMKVSVDVLGANDLVMKVLSNILVIILNYVISRLVVFRKN